MHRTASINEYSTRYSVAIDSRAETAPDEWRMQSDTNKQGSAPRVVTEWPDGVAAVPVGNTGRVEIHGAPVPYMLPVQLEQATATPGDYLSEVESRLHQVSQATYEARIRFGVAREQARKDLPLSTYTEAYWKIDLHNLLHFLGLRMDAHAQAEIREYADIIYGIVKVLYPAVAEAFEDYRLNAVTFSAPELRHLAAALQWIRRCANPTSELLWEFLKLESDCPEDWRRPEKLPRKVAEFFRKLSQVSVSE